MCTPYAIVAEKSCLVYTIALFSPCSCPMQSWSCTCFPTVQFFRLSAETSFST